MKLTRKFDIKTPSTQFFRDNRNRLMNHLVSSGVVPSNGLIFLKGPVEQNIYDDDMEYRLAPENTFYYTTGLVEQDTFSLLDLEKKTTSLYVKFPEPMKTYWVNCKSKQSYEQDTGIEEIINFSELKKDLEAKVCDRPLFLYSGINPVSGIPTLSAEKLLLQELPTKQLDTSAIFAPINRLRLVKSPEEIELLRQATKVAASAFESAAAFATAGHTEAQVAAAFETAAIFAANAEFADEPIVAGGQNATFLHHTPSGVTPLVSGQPVLLDFACRLAGYAGVVARTIPVGSAFTQTQRALFEAAARIQKALLAACLPGTLFTNIENATRLEAINELTGLGLLLPNQLSETEKIELSFTFLPLPLASFVGLYTQEPHDGLKVSGVEGLLISETLEEGMTLTAQIGIFFIPALLEKLKESQKINNLINWETIESFEREATAIKFKDSFVISTSGAERFVDLPLSVDELENFVAKARKA